MIFAIDFNVPIEVSPEGLKIATLTGDPEIAREHREHLGDQLLTPESAGSVYPVRRLAA